MKNQVFWEVNSENRKISLLPLSAFQIKMYVQSNRTKRAFKILQKIPIILRTKHSQILHIHAFAYSLFSSSSSPLFYKPRGFPFISPIKYVPSDLNALKKIFLVSSACPHSKYFPSSHQHDNSHLCFGVHPEFKFYMPSSIFPQVYNYSFQ